MNALLAIFDAWLNLSHRENATVIVMVRTNAIAGVMVSNSSFSLSHHPNNGDDPGAPGSTTHPL